MKYKGIIYFAIIFLISTFLKIYFVINVELDPIYDFKTLYSVAVNLYNGEGFTLDGYNWGFQSYGYPLFLSIFFRLVGSTDIFMAKVFNILVSTLTLPIVFLIFNKIFKNKKTIYITSFIFAFLPNNITYTNVLGSEVLSVFLLALLILVALYMNEKNKKINLVLQGVLCGILSLVKPFFMAFPIVLLFIFFIKEKKLKPILFSAIFITAGFMMIMLPSIVKNYRAFNAFIPISYNGGFTLYINNNSENTRGTWINGYLVPKTEEFKEKLEDIGYDLTKDAQIEKEQNLRNYKASKLFADEAKNWIITHPGEFIGLGALRVVNVFFCGASDIFLWSFTGDFINGLTNSGYRWFKVFKGVADAFVFLLSISFIILLILNIKNIFLKKTELSLLITIWTMLFFYAVYFVVEGQARYNFPTLILMTMALGFLIDNMGHEDVSNLSHKK